MTFLLMLAGFAMLVAGTWRQAAMFFGRVPARRFRLALLGSGYALLALSLASVLAGDDPARALVGWFGELTLAAIAALLGCWVWQCKREGVSGPRVSSPASSR
jgi:hypothetical protein